MKQAMREHFRSCGRIEAFLKTYAYLSTGEREHEMYGELHQYCWYCPVRTMFSCPDYCELGTLFAAGWQEGLAQARLAFETGDLAIFEDIGRAAGFTSRRPPRNYRYYTAERDGADGKLRGEALRHFIQSWRQTGGDRRRIKGV